MREVLVYFILFVSIASAITDLLYKKIYNAVTLPSIAIGLVASAFIAPAPQTFLHALLACLAVFGVGILVFKTSHFGAGDVKLLMALAALGGSLFIAEVLFLSLLLGGVMAVIQLASRGKLLKWFDFFRLSLLKQMNSQIPVEVPEIDSRLKIPFALPISLAVGIIFLMRPEFSWMRSLPFPLTDLTREMR